ncbi:MAG: hypothetical protein JSS10_05860 [Verrucomicrobia bacterium]|nr:hypothetical protein [Verrucomicrobiota bacterium]
MTTKTAPLLFIQETSITTAGSPLPTSGFGEAALEIQKTTGQVAQKEAQEHAAVLLTPRPSLSGRVTPISSSVTEEELLFTPPSKRDNQSQPLPISPGADARVPAAAAKTPFSPLRGALWGAGSDCSSAQNSPSNASERSEAEASAPESGDEFETAVLGKTAAPFPRISAQAARLEMAAETSSGDSTPTQSSPAKAEGTPSPIKAVKQVITQSDLTCKPMPKTHARVQRGVDCLNSLRSPEHSTQVAAVRNAMASSLAQTSPVASVPPKKPTQRNLLLAMEHCSTLDDSWTPLFESTQTFVLDIGHLRNFNGAGKHICPAGDPDDAKISKRYTNLSTGVWCGMIAEGKKGEKFSSLIPRSMTEQEYLTLLSEALSRQEQLMARGGNKALLRLADENNPLYVEIYTEQKGHKVNSAFPIFHYEEYTEKSTILRLEMEFEQSIQSADPITRVFIEIPYATILKEVKTLKKNDEVIEFETKTHQIIDVALLLSSVPGLCPIARGILVSIPKKAL